MIPVRDFLARRDFNFDPNQDAYILIADGREVTRVAGCHVRQADDRGDVDRRKLVIKTVNEKLA